MLIIAYVGDVELVKLMSSVDELPQFSSPGTVFKF